MQTLSQFSKEEIIQKLKYYCNYQERCHREVKEKLYSLNLRKADVESVLADLIELDIVNEERFAIAFTRGKFNLKKWGKQKIKAGLKQKSISEYCIKKALNTINNSDYENVLNKLADKKLKELKHEKNIFIKKRKLQNYLLQKGFESSLINSFLKAI